MRDLRQDLEDYHRYMAERSLKVVDLMVDSFPHAIDRALRGENFIKGLNKELADAQDQKSRAKAEIERLRENLCGACESLTQATGHGWKDTCCNCEWYKTDRVTRESEGE